MNPIVHFEIPAEDFDRAQKFYSTVFGWTFQNMPSMDYSMVMTTTTGDNGMANTPGAINGGMGKKNADFSNPVLVIKVDSIDEFLEKIKAAGGVVVHEKGEVADMGYYAQFKDSEGVLMGLWQNK